MRPLYNNWSLHFAQNTILWIQVMQVNFPKKCINCAINDTINCHWLVLIWRLYWHGGINLSPSVCSPQDGLMNRYERLRRSCSLWRQEKCRKFAATRVDNYNLNWVPSVIPSVAGNCAYLEWSVDDTDRTAEVIWSRVSWTRLCKSSWGGDNNQQKSTNRPDTKCKAEETSSARSSRALFWGSGVRYAISILTLFNRLINVYDDQLGVCIGILDVYYLTEKRLRFIPISVTHPCPIFANKSDSRCRCRATDLPYLAGY